MSSRRNIIQWRGNRSNMVRQNLLFWWAIHLAQILFAHQFMTQNQGILFQFIVRKFGGLWRRGRFVQIPEGSSWWWSSFGSTNPTSIILKWMTLMLRTSCVSSTGLMFVFGITSSGGTYFYGHYRCLRLMTISATRYTTRSKSSNSSSPIMNSFVQYVLHGYMKMAIGQTGTDIYINDLHQLLHVKYRGTGKMFLMYQELTLIALLQRGDWRGSSIKSCAIWKSPYSLGWRIRHASFTDGPMMDKM